MKRKVHQVVGSLKFLTPVFMVSGLVLAAVVIYELKDQLTLIKIAHINLLFVAASFQGIVLVVTALAWKKNTALHHIGDISFLESVAHVGVNSLGKYLPGKIAGSVFRGAEIHKNGGSLQAVIIASLIEQVAIIHSGILIAMVLLTYNAYGVWAGVVFFIISIISIFFIKYLKPVLQWVIRKFKPAMLSFQNESGLDDVRSYGIVFGIISSTWVLTALAVYCCVIAFGASSGISFLEVLLITVFAFMGGFAAFFVPAGIGVREGIMVSMLTPLVGFSVAVAVSVLHRLILILFDILLGSYSLFYKRPFSSF